MTEMAGRHVEFDPRLGGRRPAGPLAEDRPAPDLGRATGGISASYNNRIVVDGRNADGSGRFAHADIDCSNNDEIFSFHQGGANSSWRTGRCISFGKPSTSERSPG